MMLARLLDEGQANSMEQMTIELVSVTECKGSYLAIALADALDARITIIVRFESDQNSPPTELWQRARDEVLRYLDIA